MGDLKYYDKIDGLRFIAISLVLIEHFGRFIEFSAGYYGVDLFFVISGFLITSILLKLNGPFWTSYKSFIGRRTLRIFPIYYLVILVLWTLQLDVVRLHLLSLLTYTFNYAMIYWDLKFSPVNHFWSLCVEEQFYLFWPFIVLALRKQKTVLVWLILAIIAASFAQMCFGILTSISQYNIVNLLTRMGSLSFGALAAIVNMSDNISKRILNSKILEYLMFMALIIALLIAYPIKFFLLAGISFYFVLKSAHSDFNLSFINNLLRNRIVVFIGSISYGIYIYHLPLEYYFARYVFDPIWLRIDFHALGFFERLRWNSWLVKLPLYSGLSVLLAAISYRYIEQPILRQKDRYFKYG